MTDVLRLVAENKRRKAISLDLDNCGLTKVPAEVGELVWLQSLSLAGNESLTDLGPLASLLALEWLRVSNTKITDLSPLTRLSALQTLEIHNTQVSDLGPLAGLLALRLLRAYNTQISDLGPLAGLSTLRKLDMSGTLITDLAPLAGLPALRSVDVSNTSVTDLSPLIALIRRGLPVRFESYSWVGDGIYVKNCPLSTPPLVLVHRGNEAMLNYFADRAADGVDHLYEAKMLILGEGGAGKTSLLRRLYQPAQPLPMESEATRGIAIYRHEFKIKNGRPFRLNVWDFGGQQIYHATHQFFLTHRSLYVIVDDTRKDYRSASDEGFKYWLELIDVFGGHSPILIFQNEKDGRTKSIDFEGIKRRYGNVEKCYAGNLEKPSAADKVRDGIEFFASNLSHVGDPLPARWIKVRADIELRARKTAYVPVQEYFDIYRRHMEFDRSKALHLSRYLHDLGVFLHYQDDPLLARTVILQNEWATAAVFRILDDEIVKAKFGRFNSDDCERLWRSSVYADMHPELLALMKRFELCYELRDSKPSTWLAPQLLPATQPSELVAWDKPQDLVLRYRYDFLPKGMISRLTVRLHRFIRDPEMAWVNGALFERDDTAALVRILPNGTEIELRARGTESKELLSVIAADLDALNESFEGLCDKVNRRIPCICKVCRAELLPEFFVHKELLRRREHNKLKVECRRSFEDVDVLELLDGIKNLNTLPVWANRREVRIFLASSAEFSEERDDFELYVRRENDERLRQGFYLKIVRWENFLDAMSKTRLQDEYNKAISDCDIFISLFFTKAGKYTEEEFDIAFREYLKHDRPRIFTFFKDAPVSSNSLRREDFDSLRAFQDKVKELGHFPTVYTNTDDLKLKFHKQLDMVLEQMASAS